MPCGMKCYILKITTTKLQQINLFTLAVFIHSNEHRYVYFEFYLSFATYISKWYQNRTCLSMKVIQR